jgi:hypothetical protein
VGRSSRHSHNNIIITTSGVGRSDSSAALVCPCRRPRRRRGRQGPRPGPPSPAAGRRATARRRGGRRACERGVLSPSVSFPVGIRQNLLIYTRTGRGLMTVRPPHSARAAGVLLVQDGARLAPAAEARHGPRQRQRGRRRGHLPPPPCSQMKPHLPDVPMIILWIVETL